MAGSLTVDTLQADSTSTLVLKNGVANTPPTIQDSAGTQIGTFCRAWVNFDGTTNVGGFCTARASFNVSTVADNGTGDYTINFTNAMPDINYTVVANAGFLAGPGYPAPVALFANNSTGATVTPTVSAARITTRNSAFNPADVAYITTAVFR